MTNISAMSSPTLTSFYTNYEDPKLRPLKLCQNTKARAIVVNRPEDATPYICLRGRLTQAVCNKYLFLCIFVAVQMQLFTSNLLQSLSQAESLINMSCHATTSTGTTQVMGANRVASIALDNMYSELSISAEMAILSATSTLRNTQSQTLYYLNLLSHGYNYAVTSAVHSGITSAQNVTASSNKWLHNELQLQVAPLQEQLNDVSKGLQSLESTLSDSFFTNISLNSKSRISLVGVENIMLPTDISLQLTSFNRTVEFGFNSIALSYGKKTQLDAEKWLSRLNSTNATIQPSITDIELMNPITGVVCPTVEAVNVRFASVTSKIVQLRRNILIAVILLGVLTIMPVAVYEYFAWRQLLDVTRTMSEVGHSCDPANTIFVARRPALSCMTNASSFKLFPDDTNARIIFRWFFSYIFSDAMRFLLNCFATLLVLYCCEVSAVKIVSGAVNENQDLTLMSSNSTLASGVESWATEINRDVTSAQNTSNNNLQDILAGAFKDMRQNFVMASSEMAGNFEKRMTGIGYPNFLNNSLLYEQLPLESFEFAGLAYPLLNASSIVETIEYLSFAGPSSNVSSRPNSFVSEAISSFEYTCSAHLQIAMAMLSVWLVYVFGALIYTLKPGVVRVASNIRSRVPSIKMQNSGGKM